MKTLAWLYDQPSGLGTLKQFPTDFVVEEDLGFKADGEGEHLLVRVRKTGCNTTFVADYLAKFAGISVRAVSYAGLKDRHAVTEQWFCLHLPGKETPDFTKFDLAGCQIMTYARHLRKLRIGALRGNTFRLIIRQVSKPTAIEVRLTQIAAQGVPNYFGEQRFGHNGNNIVQAKLWATNAIRVKERGKRSFYLSAARSLIFNEIASRRIELGMGRTVIDGDAMQLSGRGSWFVAKADELEVLQQRLQQGEIQITAPLAGDGELGTQSVALAFEQQQLVKYDILLSLLHRERVECARRMLLVQPKEMSWSWLDRETLQLNFWLPAGSFATSVVRELIKPNSETVEMSE